MAEKDPQKFFASLGISRGKLVEMLDKLPPEIPRTSTSQPKIPTQRGEQRESFSI